MVITEPALPSKGILGSKLYPGNMPRMLNKDRTRFSSTPGKIEQAKERLCWWDSNNANQIGQNQKCLGVKVVHGVENRTFQTAPLRLQNILNV